MKIKYYCPIWGMKHLPLADVLQRIKASGYDGAEIALNPDLMDVWQVKQLFEDNGLDFLVQHPYGRGANFDEAISNYRSKMETLLKLNPVMINCHSGKDFFTFEQNLEFLKSAEEYSKASGITIAHETHRGTFSFAAAVMDKYLEACPGLKLTADFSHWCVVSESLLENQQDTIDRVIPHCVLIHARVGYAQGPQVPNPAAPEYQKELLQHTKWWQQVLDWHKLTQKEELLITCEFGPPPYMHTLPFTDEPVAAQYEMNLFIKNYLSKNLIP
jgi:sugar phosphate isomerase/epimerase